MGKKRRQVLPNHERNEDQQSPANHGEVGSLRGRDSCRTPAMKRMRKNVDALITATLFIRS